MMSGDGLVVRVRPHAGRLTAAEAVGIAEAARARGNGLIDLSSRANLQLRGVRADSHGALIRDLDRLGLLDADPGAEARRNIVVTPFWNGAGRQPVCAHVLALSLEHCLAASGLALPGKFGFAVDCGHERVLSAVPADIRIERGTDGGLIVRPDGATMGVPVPGADVAETALAMAHWFIETGGVCDGRGRMAAHIRKGSALPPALAGSCLPVSAIPHTGPGQIAGGALVAVAFGSMHADTLENLTRYAYELRITPWRMIFLPEARAMPSGPELITRGDNPLLRVEACPGASFCPQTRGETRALARVLAPHVPNGASLHVSGCAKGCACTRPSTVTLVAGGDRGFDLVREGTASDCPVVLGLSAGEIAGAPARLFGVH